MNALQVRFFRPLYLASLCGDAIVLAPLLSCAHVRSQAVLIRAAYSGIKQSWTLDFIDAYRVLCRRCTRTLSGRRISRRQMASPSQQIFLALLVLCLMLVGALPPPKTVGGVPLSRADQLTMAMYDGMFIEANIHFSKKAAHYSRCRTTTRGASRAL